MHTMTLLRGSYSYRFKREHYISIRKTAMKVIIWLIRTEIRNEKSEFGIAS